jgi:hypothetical protein
MAELEYLFIRDCRLTTPFCEMIHSSYPAGGQSKLRSVFLKTFSTKSKKVFFHINGILFQNIFRQLFEFQSSREMSTEFYEMLKVREIL